jgi:rod shape-determining protein MreD
VSRALVSTAGLLALVAAQAAVAPRLAVGGTRPDLLLEGVLLLGLLRGVSAGWLGGAAAGLCLDLLRGRQLGLFALGMAAAGALAGEAARRAYPSRVGVRLAVAFLGTAVDQAVVVGLYRASGGAVDWFGAADSVLRQAAYNGAVLLVAYGPVARSGPWRHRT